MPLDSSQIELLEKALDHQYVELLEEVREELKHTGDGEYVELLGRGGADTGEEAVRDLLWGLNATLFDRHIREIREIEDARTRIREGEYGICTDCGEEIVFERLEARPAANRCIYCQRQHERTHAFEANPNL
jgi:RNA polymerase-binding protein DksA